MLIVEDEFLVLIMAESMLEQAGHEILPAHSLSEAKGIIHSPKAVDLVFTDVELGSHGGGGIMIGELVERERPGTPVLYTSGHAAPCKPFLPKPYTSKQLIEAVANLLQQPFSVRPQPN